MLYATAGKSEKGKRTHIWAGAMMSLHNTVMTAMMDTEATPQRAAVRSAVAMAMATWGCRTDPCEWRFEEIESELEAYLKRSPVKHIGDAFLLACIKLGAMTSDGEAQAEAADPAVEMGVELAGTARLARLHEMPANDAMRADARRMRRTSPRRRRCCSSRRGRGEAWA